MVKGGKNIGWNPYATKKGECMVDMWGVYCMRIQPMAGNLLSCPVRTCKTLEVLFNNGVDPLVEV